MRGIITIQHSCLFLGSLMLLAGCNQSFEPLQENEKSYFSIYGYLDAAVDTQWVRVGPARRNINEPPDPTGIKVTLEHIQSEETVIMNDSLFASKDFLNYWTTMDIENEQTYRITAERDGKSSHVTVTTPKQRIGYSEYSVERKQFFIAAGGPEWDDNISFTNDLEYFLDQSFTNVENGLGYVVGIDSKWFTQRTCLNANKSAYAPCLPDSGPFWFN